MAGQSSQQEIRPFGHGLNIDLKNLDAEVTEAERKSHDAVYMDLMGRVHPAFSFWLDQGQPGVLKRFRVISDTIPAATAPLARPGEKRRAPFNPYTVGSLAWYAMVGFEEGARYVVHTFLREGLRKPQILELLAFVFLYQGPHGMEVVANATAGMDWTPRPEAPVFPAGWKADPDAFKSGLDFTTLEMSDEEFAKLRRWHLENEGEVPRYVELLGKYRPDVLKAYRLRWENIFRVLPKQCMPYLMIRMEAQRGFAPGIREGVLLGKKWGLTRDEVVEMLCWSGFLFGTPAAISLADEVVGDVLRDWS